MIGQGNISNNSKLIAIKNEIIIDVNETDSWKEPITFLQYLYAGISYFPLWIRHV